MVYIAKPNNIIKKRKMGRGRGRKFCRKLENKRTGLNPRAMEGKNRI